MKHGLRDDKIQEVDSDNWDVFVFYFCLMFCVTSGI